MCVVLFILFVVGVGVGAVVGNVVGGGVFVVVIVVC